MTTAFKPSEVALSGSFPPLCATMGKTEAEVAAAILVRVCQVDGDAWAPVTFARLGIVVADDIEAAREPMMSISRNPFCVPDFDELERRGFCRRTTEEPGAPMELTEAGIARLARWVRP